MRFYYIVSLFTNIDYFQENSLEHLSILGSVGIIYLGLFASCIIYLLIIYLIKLTGSVKQSLVQFIMPIIATLEDVLVLHEGKEKAIWLQVVEYVGVFIVIVSVFIVLNSNDDDEIKDEKFDKLLDDENNEEIINNKIMYS